MIDESILKNEEKAMFVLRSLYKQYGYLPFKMSKFEEYELYAKNKEFLVSDKVITFNDTNGKLMALKPDVTLSIVKNGDDMEGVKQKVYYNENCYRVSKSTYQYKEIMQTGIECIGDLDLYDVYESILLATKSLELISKEFLLEISHLGILSTLLDDITQEKEVRLSIIDNISKKNTHDLRRICKEQGISEVKTECLCKVISIYGNRHKVIEQLEDISKDISIDNEIAELKELSGLLDILEYSNNIIFDFSIVNDMSYYNGIVFKGFIQGIYESVLTGGQYDKLMEKLERSSKAIGFAIYMDRLEELDKVTNSFDVDVLLIYREADKLEVASIVNKFIKEGRSVTALKSIPKKLRYQELIDLREEDTYVKYRITKG